MNWTMVISFVFNPYYANSFYFLADIMGIDLYMVHREIVYFSNGITLCKKYHVFDLA